MEIIVVILLILVFCVLCSNHYVHTTILLPDSKSVFIYLVTVIIIKCECCKKKSLAVMCLITALDLEVFIITLYKTWRFTSSWTISFVIETTSELLMVSLIMYDVCVGFFCKYYFFQIKKDFKICLLLPSFFFFDRHIITRSVTQCIIISSSGLKVMD